MNRVDLVKKIESHPLDSDSNLKFLTLLRSRLIEEGIPADYSSKIASVVDFDLSNVPEDDDTLSDIATALASYQARVYKQLSVFGQENINKFPTFTRYFAPFRITVDH